MESKTVKIDYAKLTGELQNRGKTNIWLSGQLAKNKTFVSDLKKRPEQSEQVENLICMVLGVEKGTFVMPEKKAEEPKVAGEITVINNLHRDVKSLLAVMENVADSQEKIWNKLNTHTVKLERISERTKTLEKDGHSRAVDFLKDALADGEANSEEIIVRSETAGIKHSDLMRAKNTIGVASQAKGIGKNQKVWWSIPR